MSGKKKVKNSPQSSKGVSPQHTPHHTPSELVDQCILKVLYSGKKGEINNQRKGMVNVGDLKRLGLRSGSSVILHCDDNIKIVCDLWVSNQALPGNITISRFWTPILASKQVLVTTRTSVCIQNCTSMILRIESILPKEDFQTPSFRAYLLLSCLADCPLFEKSSFNLSWRGEIIVCIVKDMKCSTPPSLIDDGDTAYQINSTTKIRILFPDDADAPVSAGMAILLEDISDDVSKIKSPIMRERVPWESLPFAGYRSEVEEAQRVIESGFEIPFPVNNNADTLKMKFKRPRGLLLSGPRGTGKTLFMNSLKEYFSPWFASTHSISSDILLSRYQGEAERQLQLVFTSAQQNSPALILIDEIDVLCANRSGNTESGYAEVQKRVLACLLTLLDGVIEDEQRSDSHIFVIGTSSSPDDIDPAMRRPGRLDKEIELAVPSQIDRENILLKLLQQMNVNCLDSEANSAYSGVRRSFIHQLSKKAHGMVGSDLLLVCKESFAISLQRQKSELLDLTFDGQISEDDLSVAVTQVSPSGIREVAVEVPEVRWNDIGGMEIVKQSLREVVEWPLQYPELFEKMGVQPPRGVLLYGPPGCSKTLMAKALATESGLNFLTVRGPELLSKWLGDSEKAVQKLFHRARSCAPSLIFFDEIDAFASKRGDSSSGVNDRVLAQLLTEIDGGGGVFQGTKRVVVVAATNRPDMLDPALLRPGRIDRKIYVPPPDSGSREQILRNCLAKMPPNENIDFEELISLTNGYSGAEVVSSCTEAAILAIEENSRCVEQKHLRHVMRNLKPQITPGMLEYYQSISQQFYS